MSTATLTRTTSAPGTSPNRAGVSSVRVARRRPAVPRGPRMLLPPLTEPAVQVLPVVPPGLPGLRPVGSAVTERAWQQILTRAQEPQPPLPDPADVCGPVVLAAVEALSGARPVTQLVRWVSPPVYEALTARLREQVDRPATVRRATVLRSHLCRLSGTLAEASVVIHDGTRVRAGAVRLEVHRGHWRASVLQIG